ncbi:MAG: LPS export ABC transporter permease LptG [Desulfobacterota bacterium]|nr:LPS export ABC transporter permease LptG [Thermodesulfobacteriota bacterium]MDW8001765.1 LPS export ABC transporter permease LptG [Deltaproteobacteria bacterium]
MKRLDKYLIGTTIKVLLICEAAGLCVFTTIDFFENIDLFASSWQNFALSLVYLAFRMPHFANLVLPLAFLISMLVTFTIMIRNNEMIAIRSSGISTLFFVRPLLYLALILTFVNFFVSEFVSAEGLKVSEHIFRARIKKEEAFISYKNDGIWIKKGNVISKIDLFDGRDDTVKGVTVIELSDGYRIKRRFDAKEGFFSGEKWILKDVIERNFDESGVLSKKVHTSLSGLIHEPPQAFKNVQRNPDEMSIKELLAYIKRLKENGYSVKRYMVDIHNKVSFPFVNVVMVTLACSIGFRYSKSKQISYGIFLGLVIGASYWLIHSLSLSLGYSEIFPPIFSAWLTNLLFFSSGIIGVLTLRT